MKGDQLAEQSKSDTKIKEPEVSPEVRPAKLEHDNHEHLRLSEQRLVLAELKIEALRAGIIDLDGLKFLDVTEMRLSEDGEVVGGPESISQLKRSKPWLFLTQSSSSSAVAPSSAPMRQKLARDMTEAEYKVARANMIKRSAV